MEEKTKGKIIVAVITAVASIIVAVLTTYGIMKANAPVTTNIILPDGQAINAQAYADLEANYQAVRAELDALKESLVAPANAESKAPIIPQMQESTAPITKVPDAEWKELTAVCPAYEWQDDRYFEYAIKTYDGTDVWSIAGVKYTSGLTWWIGKHVSNGMSFSIYNLDGKYTEISGVLGHLDGCSQENSSLQIFYDGVLKDEIPLTYNMPPHPLTLDVHGVAQLRFVVVQPTEKAPDGSKTFWGGYGIGDTKIR